MKPTTVYKIHTVIYIDYTEYMCYIYAEKAGLQIIIKLSAILFLRKNK